MLQPIPAQPAQPARCAWHTDPHNLRRRFMGPEQALRRVEEEKVALQQEGEQHKAEKAGTDSGLG